MKRSLMTLILLSLIFAFTSECLTQELDPDFLQRIRIKGARSALDYFRNFHENFPDSIIFQREAINDLGWIAAANGRLEEAICLFELNLLAYPHHYDPWDSYAEAVLERSGKGDLTLAIRCFEKSLALNPSNNNATQRLQVLKNYSLHEFMIPMRDGICLYTQVYMPKDKSRQYPILYQREWYGVRKKGSAYKQRLHPNKLLVNEGFIFVHQDIRGRFKSEGQFAVLRPYIPIRSNSNNIDESMDAYDTVEWLLANLEGHNGRVGIYGGSYAGWSALMAALQPHPAVKAVMAGASPADWWMGDDMHHNGAFRLMYAYSWAGMDAWPRPGGPSSSPVSWPGYTTRDGYRFFLETGPLKNINATYFNYENPTWNEFMLHGDYDEYWKERNILQYLNTIHVPVLNVIGWFDAEDYRGPLMIYKTIEENNPESSNSVVIGPWKHGGWNKDGEILGDIDFGSQTGYFYQKEIEYPFFMHYLKDIEVHDLPEAYVFQTGRNEWKKLDSWPPATTTDLTLYMEDHEKLTFAFGSTDENSSFDEFFSDPNKPVPWSTSIQTQQGHVWMVGDQRFASCRPDVLVWETAPLEEDISIAGPIIACLYVSTTGTDADWIVKLIDVHPPDAGKRLGDYQMLLAGDVFRSKYRNSFEHPEPLVPQEITKIEFSLLDKFHTFKKGHRIMVQIQSSWFPVIDRNPQVFCDIYHAEEKDFQKAIHRIYHSREYKSCLKMKLWIE